MRFRFPIRFKILLTLLLVSSMVVGVITFTMAQLFHADKTAYIHDLTSVIALHTAEEANALLVSYAERLDMFAQIMPDSELSEELDRIREYKARTHRRIQNAVAFRIQYREPVLSRGGCHKQIIIV